MVDHAVDGGIANIGELDGGLIEVGAGVQRTSEETFEEKPMHDRHHGRVSKDAGIVDSDLNIFDGNGKVPPDCLHHIEFEWSQSQRVIPVPH